MDEYWDKARERMKGKCRVCPVCDGLRCPSGVPGMGGAGNGASFRANVDALAARRLNLRLIHDKKEPKLAASLLGLELSMPVLAAPVAGVGFNMSAEVSEEDYIRSVIQACAEAGLAAGCGDGAMEMVYRTALAGGKGFGPKVVPFIKPWQPELLFERLNQFIEAGSTVGGVDIDAAGLITLTKMGKPVGPKTVDEWREIIGAAKIKLVLKGVMTVADALAAVEAGAAGIVVSNHGGRVLESTPGTAEVLADIAKAVDGRLTVLADGGVRSGADVLKMLALGADGVLLGRPLAIAAIGGGKEGALAYLNKIKAELTSAMILTGCGSLKDIGPQILA